MKDKFKTINNLSNKINNITEKFNGLNYNKTSKKLKYFNYKLMDIDFNNLIEKQNNIVNSINKTSHMLIGLSIPSICTSSSFFLTNVK